MTDNEFLDYYKTFCELTIWFKKIVLHSNKKAVITIKDIAGEFISERNRILTYVPVERKIPLRRKLNKIATGYYSRVTHWTRTQKVTLDMV
jgi:hypothetical protein